VDAKEVPRGTLAEFLVCFHDFARQCRAALVCRCALWAEVLQVSIDAGAMKM
jgi:hypothetical protein